MSAFTDRLYASWLKTQHRGPSGRSGYGAAPHAERREGYPTGQTNPPESCSRPRTTWRYPACSAGTRDGSPRASDAAPRPERQAVGLPAASPFLPEAEKSSIESKA